jgi:hypothetical protein
MGLALRPLRTTSAIEDRFPQRGLDPLVHSRGAAPGCISASPIGVWKAASACLRKRRSWIQLNSSTATTMAAPITNSRFANHSFTFPD